MVLFGGFSLDHPAGFGDTWVWDGTNWTEQAPSSSPTPRLSPTMAYDSAHGQVVLFGGSGVSVDNDTWIWDGTNWTQQSPQASPPGRYSAAMAYDAAHGQTVLFGGVDGNLNLLNDTWVWDGTNWTPKSPATSPTPRIGPGLVYDSGHGQIVLFGGSDPANNLIFDDTWVWDGSNWTREIPANFPTPPRSDIAVAYDASTYQTLVFGGFPNIFGGSGINDLWAFSFGPPLPVITAVVNGASFQGGGVVPGEIATAFGTNLTSGAGINPTLSLPLPTAFLNDSLVVNNKPVALFAVDNVNGQQQYNFQVPWEISSGPTVTISASNDGSSSASITLPVLTAQPGIFNYSAGGNTFGAILHANFQLANTANPAKPGETMLIYCTGLGAVSSPPADGEPGKGQPTHATPTVTIGGANAIVSFSGLAPGFVGLYQINAEVPATSHSGNQPVVVEMGGVSSNSVLLPVE